MINPTGGFCQAIYDCGNLRLQQSRLALSKNTINPMPYKDLPEFLQILAVKLGNAFHGIGQIQQFVLFLAELVKGQ